MMPAIFSPSPVSVTTPTMMPAVAVVAATDSTPLPPASSAASELAGPQRRFGPDEAQGDSQADRPEHRPERGHPQHHEAGNRDQRREVVAVPPRQLREREAARLRTCCVPSRRESASIIRKIDR